MKKLDNNQPDTPQDAPDEFETGSPEQTDQIIQIGGVTARKGKHVIHCLTIIGQIEGHQVLPETQKTTKYEHVMPLLANLAQSSEVDGILLLLNTVGGDIEAGLAIAELIAGMRKPTVSLVLGGGHSIGVPLAVAPRVSMIVPSASMVVHPVRTTGTVIAAPQTFRYFEKVQEGIVSFVVRHSHITADTFERLMLATDEMAADVGSVLYGEKAVELGLIDRVGTLSDALECLYEQIGKTRQQ